MSEDAKHPPERTSHRLAEIAAAARALIAERGFEGLRTRDIAERVGINIATLHYHVPTKESLIEIVAKSLRDEFHARHDARPRENLTPLALLHHEFSDFRTTLANGAETFLVFAELTERARRDPKIAFVIRPMQRFWRDRIAQILDAGRREGCFRPDLDPQAAATMVIGAMIAAHRHDEDIGFFDRVIAELERALRNSPSGPNGPLP